MIPREYERWMRALEQLLKVEAPDVQSTETVSELVH
jgi:hypothetical protein